MVTKISRMTKMNPGERSHGTEGVVVEAPVIPMEVTAMVMPAVGHQEVLPRVIAVGAKR